MNKIPHQENKQKQLQIIQSLKLRELLKKLFEEVNSLDVKSNLTTKKNDHVNQNQDDFIDQCINNSMDDFNSSYSSFLYQIDQDQNFTKRGNFYLFENGLKVFKCKECQETFDTPQKLGTHTSKIHHKLQKIKKKINKK
ncbi:unnamed protein product [Paramecium primaurelia]|uniref:C2H2-type domain-containing protein n=1 Tax=Paramecium primaurelia TaxID=5886 RepID=A0A8S1JRT3_PARPR|nr:unnamed protein product [Paramecium primaurelia]